VGWGGTFFVGVGVGVGVGNTLCVCVGCVCWAVGASGITRPHVQGGREGERGQRKLRSLSLARSLLEFVGVPGG